MKVIKLQEFEWTYDESQPLGSPGGFGSVYLGFDSDGQEVAIKRLHQTAKELAHRELEIADKLMGRELKHVLPFLDAGLDTESDGYFLVMLKGENDLQRELESSGKFSEDKAVLILKDITCGLLEVSDLVHRDLKPANILYHEGKWKIADFGIARFVEEATSSQTLKRCLSPQYAAPEQWQDLHATHLTDVYALGCIGFALLTGSPPFSGPGNSDYKKQHLNQAPPKVDIHIDQLRSLLSMMLRKNPDVRPELERINTILKSISETQSDIPRGLGFKALTKAGASDAERLSREEAEEAKAKSDWENRFNIYKGGFAILRDILQELVDYVREVAPTAVINFDGQSGSISLGLGVLEWSFTNVHMPIPKDEFSESHWDVVAGAIITIHQRSANDLKFGSNLWYMRRSDKEPFRWNEVSYMSTPFADQRGKDEPFELFSFEQADLAASSIFGANQIAFGPKLMDDEDKHDFIERWLKHLADASEGRMQRPRSLPY